MWEPLAEEPVKSHATQLDMGNVEEAVQVATQASMPDLVKPAPTAIHRMQNVSLAEIYGMSWECYNTICTGSNDLPCCMSTLPTVMEHSVV